MTVKFILPCTVVTTPKEKLTKGRQSRNCAPFVVPIWKWSANKKFSTKYVAYGAKSYSELKILLMVFPTKDHGSLKFMRK
jgi:hypothetical protein